MKKCLLLLLLFLVFCLVGCGTSNKFEGIYSKCYLKNDSVCDEDVFTQINEGIVISYKSSSGNPITIEYGKTYEEFYKKPLDVEEEQTYTYEKVFMDYLEDKYSIVVSFFAWYKDMGDGYIYPIPYKQLWKYTDGKIIIVSSTFDEYVYYKKIKNI